jgi:hypothetical protein
LTQRLEGRCRAIAASLELTGGASSTHNLPARAVTDRCALSHFLLVLRAVAAWRTQRVCCRSTGLDQVCACAAARAQAANPDAVGITATAISTFGTCPGADFARERKKKEKDKEREIKRERKKCKEAFKEKIEQK